MPKPQTGFPPLPKHKAEGWKYEKKKKKKGKEPCFGHNGRMRAHAY